MDIEKMERQAEELTERIKAAKIAKAKAEREARWAAQRAEQANRSIKMFEEYAEPFGVPREVAESVYSLAWSHGHASGYSEVENYYQDFAELARKAYEQGITDAG